MFNRIKEYFTGEISTLDIDPDGNPTDHDVRIATGVLLLEMAGSDRDYAPEEVQTIFRVMEKEFGLSDSESLDLLESADALRQEKGKLDEFVKAINDNFNDSQRKRVYGMIWKVVVADGLIEKFEERLAKQMQSRLQLSDAQAEEARKLIADA